MLKKILLTCCLLIGVSGVHAEDSFIDNLTIKKIHVVGDYSAGETYDSTIELWFTTQLAWPANSTCTDLERVYVKASDKHLVAAAYMALAANKKININADDSLTKRSGACELSFLDVTNL